MDQESSVIVEEVKELMEQYLKEIPGLRKPWPQSIQDRIKRLWQSGLTSKEISRLVPIPYHTIYSWGKKDPDFKPLRRRSKRTPSGAFIPVQVSATQKLDSTVTVTTSQPPSLSSSHCTVTVILPNGIRMEGVTPGFLCAWLGTGPKQDATS